MLIADELVVSPACWSHTLYHQHHHLLTDHWWLQLMQLDITASKPTKNVFCTCCNVNTSLII